MTKKKYDQHDWESKYQNEQTGWDIGEISTPLKTYFDQLKDKSIKILIPGAGFGHEAIYLMNNGFTNVWVADLAATPLRSIKQRCPHFPENRLLHEDFFKLSSSYDLIIEQTFFCALPPDSREDYAYKIHQLLRQDGKMVGLLFDFELTDEGPPYGGDYKSYLNLFEKYFHIHTLERCYNSIKPRMNRELFCIFDKK